MLLAIDNYGRVEALLAQAGGISGFSYAESTLTLTRSALQLEIADLVGVSDTGPAVPTDTADLARVNVALQMALRQFYYPVVLPGETEPWEWSFIRLVRTLVTQAGVGDYFLPPSIGAVEGDLTFATAEAYNIIRLRGEMFIRVQRQVGTSSGVPKYAAVVNVSSGGTTSPHKVLMLWPTPGSTYNISFRSLWVPHDVSATAIYPTADSIHSETLLQSCRAAADRKFNDRIGAEYALFIERLKASIALDRKTSSPDRLGYLSDPGLSRDLSQLGSDVAPTFILNGVTIQE